VAEQYKKNREAFKKQARKWTKEHADPERLKEAKIAKIVDMGFERE
jgi:hypothetical protein